MYLNHNLPTVAESDPVNSGDATGSEVDAQHVDAEATSHVRPEPRVHGAAVAGAEDGPLNATQWPVFYDRRRSKRSD